MRHFRHWLPAGGTADDQLDVWVAQFIDFGLCFGNSSRVILAADSQNLQELFGIVEAINFLEGFAIDFFFMPGG